ncbi:MAG: class I SAM-dependent methyltransferase [Anaerolineae bacterium]|nr:class I SAM-dependent methyltransferase [Anaerolineae bacterium]
MSADKKDESVDRMLETNRKQAEFYDMPGEDRGNLIYQIWRTSRLRMGRVRRAMGISHAVHELHRQWLGNLSDKSVLDLGCGAGNVLSLGLARQSASYLAIDLSERLISMFSKKLTEAQIPHARAEVRDFLSPAFTDTFDVIYIHAAMHHFEDFDAFCRILASHLNPHGFVITYDPLQTNWLVKLARILYRPFQTDKEWEWPFSKSSFATIQNHFRIAQVQGVLGYAKWAALIGLISPALGRRISKRLHQHDMRVANKLNRSLWRCMHVAMKLEPKPR